MPLYEYKCDECQNRFEELISGDQKVVCPKCGSEKVNKLLSTFAAAGGNTCGSPGGSSCGSSGFR